MNNLSDDDPQLTNFLRQHRSIVPSESVDLEDRLMSTIDLLPTTEKPPRVSRPTWRLYSVIGAIATIIFGTAIYRIVNPPEPSIAELHQLNLYLEAHAHSLVANPDDPDFDLFDDDDLTDS
jgi:hypothetical protein